MKGKVDDLKLTMEVVPKPSWGQNLRKVMPKEDWDKLRREVYQKANYQCQICGAGGKMNCHEKWEYDDKKRTQKLAGFIAICDLCHHVKHLGLAGIFSGEGKLDYEEVIKHYITVNKVSREEFEKHRKRAFDIWRKRSKYEWKIQLGEFESLIAKK